MAINPTGCWFFLRYGVMAGMLAEWTVSDDSENWHDTWHGNLIGNVISNHLTQASPLGGIRISSEMEYGNDTLLSSSVLYSHSSSLVGTMHVIHHICSALIDIASRDPDEC